MNDTIDTVNRSVDISNRTISIIDCSINHYRWFKRKSIPYYGIINYKNDTGFYLQFTMETNPASGANSNKILSLR
ncbi:MAG TPA: hypothetical protein VIH57_03575 [Bacteroidales bacterium]